jgi:2-phosphosulfolactate phosphatase
MILDAVLNPSEIAQLGAARVSGATCVVFDVLRATSSMLTGLAHGVSAVLPVRTIEEAEAFRGKPNYLLAGERGGEPIPGFDLGNSPFEYQGIPGRTVVTTTTNGTIALRACEGADHIFAAAVLNLEAMAAELRRLRPERVLLVCAGTFETFALEDAWAAGKLVELLGPGEHTDSAQAALAVTQLFPDPLAALQAARNGRSLTAAGRELEVEWCARLSSLAVVAEMKGGFLRALPSHA